MWSDAAIAKSQTVWRLQGAELAAVWRPATADVSAETRADRLRVAAAGGTIWLLGAVTFEAEDVDLRVLETSLEAGRTARLLWSRADQPLANTRAVNATADPNGRLVFPVGEHAEWTGPIGKLRFDVARGSAAFALDLRSTAGARLELGATPRSLARSAWRLELDSDRRSGWLAVAADPQSLAVAVPPRSRLRFSYGLSRRGRGGASFRVRASTRARSEVLFEQTLGGDQAGRWLDAELDLGHLGGQNAELSFEFAGAPDFVPGRRIGMWANPRLVALAPLPRPNVVLIVIDTLRADRLSRYGNPRLTSPRLDRFAQAHAVTFRNAIAAAPWTLPAHVSLFTGQDPIRHGMNWSDPAPSHFRLLAETLRAGGYETLAVTGGAYLSPQFGLDQGFDVFRHWPGQFGSAQEIEINVDRAIELIGRSSQPFFLFFHTYETHAPNPGYQDEVTALGLGADLVGRVSTNPRKLTDRAPPFLVNSPLAEPGAASPAPERTAELSSSLYDVAVAKADRHVGRLLEALQASGRFADTAIIVTSDHGEGLGDHGLAGHLYLYDWNLKVPLILSLPGGRGAGSWKEDQVRTVDIAPTVWELAGLPPPADRDGASLLPTVAGAGHPPFALSYAASTNHGLSVREANRHKVVLRNSPWVEASTFEQAYDLAGGSEVARATVPWSVAAELAAVRQRYESSIAAVKVELANPTGESMVFKLKARGLNPLKVKSVSAPCGCVRWNGKAEVEIRVDPSARRVLYLEGLHGREFTIEVVTSGIRRVLKAGEHDLGRGVRFALEEVAGAGVPGGGEVILAMQAQGTRPGEEQTDAAPRSTLEDQLRELGYVE